MFEKNVIRSRFGRKIFLLVAFCALFPLAALGILSFYHISNELHEQATRNLMTECKSIGMSIFERLSMIDLSLRALEEDFESNVNKAWAGLNLEANGYTERIFWGISIQEGAEVVPVRGSPIILGEFSPEEKQSMEAGKTAIIFPFDGELESNLFVARRMVARNDKTYYILGEINRNFFNLAEIFGFVPALTHLVLADNSNRIISAAAESEGIDLSRILSDHPFDESPIVEWEKNGTTYLSASWTLFLKAGFHPDFYRVILTQSRDDVLAPIRLFTWIFPLAILLTFLAALFLSYRLIRKNLIPLHRLREGTQRVANGVYHEKVTIESRDEFEELGLSFNAMSGQISRQFDMLATLSEIDRVVLSSLEQNPILQTILTNLPRVAPCDLVAVRLNEKNGGLSEPYHYRLDAAREELHTESFIIPSHDILELTRSNGYSLNSVGDRSASYLKPFDALGMDSFCTFPIVMAGEMLGLIVLGWREANHSSPAELAHVRQVTDQAAVALSNAKLVNELDELGWGALQALARAVDAKSPWTAGHSERVTRYAVEFARRLGMSRKELKALEQGGLLHDIGKLGIPAEILDKPGKLTDEEYGIIKTHPAVGARIVQPIAAYSHIIPLIAQHHEWFNGAGYPAGLAGENIDPGARILMLADFYDALVSDRPYRSGLPHEAVREMIRKGRGTQFDPEMASAFVDYLEKARQTNP